MPTQNIHVLKGVVSLEELCEVVAKLQKQVRYLQNKGIDSENTREIGGWQVSEDTLQALDGDVGLSTADDAPDPVRLWAGSVSKDTAPWRVHKSGFGVATGWRIQSKSGAYPYVVMDPENDLFGAYLAADKYIEIGSFGRDNLPEIYFNYGSDFATIFLSPSFGLFIGTIDRLTLQGNDGIYATNPLRVLDWARVINNSSGQTLQNALDGKPSFSYVDSVFGVSLAFDPATRNLKLFNNLGQQISIVNIP